MNQGVVKKWTSDWNQGFDISRNNWCMHFFRALLFWILWNSLCGVVFKNKVFGNWNDNWKRLSVIIKFTYTGIYLFFVFFHVIILFWLLVYAYKVSNWLRYGKNMVRMWHIVPSKIVIISLISVKEPIIDSSSHIHAQVEPFCVSNAKAVIVHRSRRTMS